MKIHCINNKNHDPHEQTPPILASAEDGKLGYICKKCFEESGRKEDIAGEYIRGSSEIFPSFFLIVPKKNIAP